MYAMHKLNNCEDNILVRWRYKLFAPCPANIVNFFHILICNPTTNLLKLLVINHCCYGVGGSMPYHEVVVPFKETTQ